MSLFTSLESILHFIKSVTSRVEILSGEECRLFEVIQQTLSKVSAKTKIFLLGKTNPDGGSHGVSGVGDRY